MLIVTGSVTAKPETFDALLEAAVAHTLRSRAEPGCLTHGVHVDCENPMRLFFYEEWADRPALDAHFAREGSNDFMKAVRELCASSTRVKILPVAPRD
ncbi:MAG: antibiotic biosynthesis monooxygenase [Phenylobacterium sp.]|uniref:putative quinol monooxygenase n=1 Tax=Phenylobacterium sp. TaxID=1871053 RepID=UPI001210DC84|nr:putative quinol monooxygenase [Phenylobacterium sp.]TAJ70518.1 MAG: antibiotic biosynthesis monooxygenase [Phenylobacterium sp.]